MEEEKIKGKHKKYADEMSFFISLPGVKVQ